MNVTVVNTILGVFTALAHVALVGLLVLLWRFPKSELAGLVNKYVMWLVFGAAFAAMAMSLVYSEVFHYAPCNLCWYQRILIYPIAILVGLALYRKDRGILPYAQFLAGFGGLIALYHHFLQFSLVPEVPCGAQSVSCSLRFVLELGYITFPLMSFTSFALIFLFIAVSKKNSTSHVLEA